ncbi:TIR domain-containing protein [Streptomyces ipomoeae]|nr:TIR domain-containing protein [Streptomyces ipomoeae]MDX2696335.1 TIR domain-containing protein [Streptomyces ipomoeae]MDX2822678.1 TIR domain-containing protein [Streptomyces ipomoeae]MDX2842081.1 TIR domain-containing protein [Streptomyces ipomoeae]MDX2875546.1 TIR domain-containing protein [Streptomyces ipomoeae]TQE27496.1 TIR domain-containing protein [Streptomyces ipomoeae]
MSESEYGISSSAGVRLHRVLGRPPRRDCGQYVAWSPDGRRLAVPVDESRVRVVDVESDTDVAVLELPGKAGYVNQVAWSPDGSRIAAACGSDGVRVWDVDRPDRSLHLKAHTGWVGEIAWSNSGDRLASGAQDSTVRIWNARGRRPLRTIEAHDDYVNGLAWSPDDTLLATGSADRTVKVWNTTGSSPKLVTSWAVPDIVDCIAWSADGRTVAAGSSDGKVVCLSIDTGGPTKAVASLEGHTDIVWEVMFSADGKILGSTALDRTIRLWRTDDWNTVAVLRLPHVDVGDTDDDQDSSVSGGFVDSDRRARPTFAFHPTLPRLALWTNQAGLSLWDYDLDVLLRQQVADESVRYLTAKVVLVGDTGVGKTGLGWRLAHGGFREHASTHGQQFWLIDDLRTQRADGTDCEAVLWDLAGQHVYRPVHAIFLDNVDLALVLFDPTNRQEPLKGVRFWLKQLSGGGGRLPPAVLVGARVDRGAPVLSQPDLDQFCQRHGISGGYVSTSAANGTGVEQLMDLLRGQIQWERMTTTVTTRTFKRIKEFALALKERPDRRGVLVSPTELRRQLRETDPEWRFTDAEMMTAVGHLENHGYVSVLRTSSGAQTVLLAPELLVDLASSVFLRADKHPQELGALSEVTLLGGGYEFPELETLDPAERQVLLDAAVVRFLEHNLCFRDTLGAETLLIFPGLIKQKRPLFDAIETVDDVSYVVRGRVENVYPALVVLLGHTPTFTRVNYWQSQAQFEMGSGDQICGFRLFQEREGEIELVLHYSDAVPRYGRTMFQGLFERFLYQRDVTVTAFPPVFCGNGHKQERSAVMGSLRHGMRTMFCFRCGDRIDLPETEQPVAFGAEDTRLVERDEAVARLRSTYETYLVRVKSFRSDRTVPRCYVSHLPADSAWAAQLARDLREAGVLVVEDAADVRDEDAVLVVLTPEHGRALDRPSGTSAADAELIRARRCTGPGRGQWSRVVPLLRVGTARTALPALLRGLVPGEFQDDTRYAVALFDLVLTLYAIPFNHPAFQPLRAALQRKWGTHMGERAGALPPSSAEPDTEVYLSYSWSEASNAVADELDLAFQARGVTVVRDRRDIGYKASIKQFMARLGQGKCVILVISDAYLKSQNCLFELLETAKHGEFADRVFPVVLPDARIYRPQDRIRYVRYWEEQIRELDEELKTVSAANLQGFREDIDLYTEIRAHLPRLADILRDMNTLSPDLHRDSDFSEIFEAVMTRLASE